MQIRSARCLAGARDIVAAASPQAICRKCIIHGEEANRGGAPYEVREVQAFSGVALSLNGNPCLGFQARAVW